MTMIESVFQSKMDYGGHWKGSRSWIHGCVRPAFVFLKVFHWLGLIREEIADLRGSVFVWVARDSNFSLTNRCNQAKSTIWKCPSFTSLREGFRTNAEPSELLKTMLDVFRNLYRGSDLHAREEIVDPANWHDMPAIPRHFPSRL